MPNMQLKKAKKRNLFLLLFAILLALSVYYFKNSEQQSNRIFLPVDINNIHEIIIHQTPSIKLKLINQEWHVMQREPFPANKKAIQDIFDMLATPLISEHSLTEVSLKELSLNPANLRVDINGDALSFGALSPIKQMHYVHFKDKVYLASPFLQIRFSQTMDTFLKTEHAYESNESVHGDH